MNFRNIALLLGLLPAGLVFFWLNCSLIYVAQANSRSARWGLRLAALSLALAGWAACRSIWSLWFVIYLHLGAFAGISLGLLGFRRIVGYLFRKRTYPGRAAGWVLLCLPFFCTVLVLGYGLWNMQQIHKTVYEVSVDKEMPAGGYRIAFISDLHFGLSMGEDKLGRIVREISAQKPDILLLGGDLVDERTELAQLEAAFAILGQTDARLGVYYVYGNHDKSLYRRQKNFTAQQLDAAIQAAGIHILRDKLVFLDRYLALAGREDLSNAWLERRGRLSLRELRQSESAHHFRDENDLTGDIMDKLTDELTDKVWILLDHQPREQAEAAEAGFDLMLSGHTHGGQIWPLGLVTELSGIEPQNYGLRRYGNMTAIVSSGIAGWGYPIRTGKHSEYLMIELHSGG